MRHWASFVAVFLLAANWAFAEVGGVRVRVAERGRAVPNAVVSLSSEDLVKVSGVTDVAGLVGLTAQQGDYQLKVDSIRGVSQSNVQIRINGLDSYAADPSNGSITHLDAPLPDLYTPPDVNVELGYRLGYRADNGLVTIDVATPYGPVYVGAPELSAPGTMTSWGVLPIPAGVDDKARKKNQKELERHSITIAEETLTLSGEGGVSVRSATEVVLTVSRGKKVVAMGTIQLLVVESGNELLIQRREQGVQMVIGGRGFTHYGSFDGNASTTSIMSGSESLPVAAESTYGTSFYTPTGLKGLSSVNILEDGMTLAARFRNIGLEFVADKYDLIRGESTMSHVTLFGLAGISGPAFLGLVNTTPGVITFIPQNTQLITVQPVDVAANGTAKFDRGLTGIRRGNFTISAILMTP
jgi:hypothetical protein